MCKVLIANEFSEGATESGVKWIHIPITVKPGWLGAEPIIGAEINIIGASEGIECPMPLFWQNRADSDKPERKITLRPGDYLIPFAARTTLKSFPLSGRTVTQIPSNLWDSWLLKKGIVRITNGAHFFTFIGLTNLSKPDFYKITVCIKDQSGKIIANRRITLAVPEMDVDNKFFYYV